MKPGALDPDYFLELRSAISKSLNIPEPRLDDLYARAMIGGSDPLSPGAQWQTASGIKMRPIRWFWENIIARGKVVVIAGHPGLGKSQLTVSFAAIATTGGRFPGTRDKCELGSVQLLSAEDDPEDTTVPRLAAAGADLNRVSILKAVRSIDPDGRERMHPFNLQDDVEQLEKRMVEVGDVSLCVIDPISAYLGPGVDSHRNSEIRALLLPLRDLAERCNVAIICVSHLNKSSSGEALMRVIESVGMVAAARAGFIVGKHPEDDSRRVFSCAKNNVGDDSISFGFSIEPVSFDHTAQRSTPPG